jgi:UDP-D-galactose:(glucosyl)LPS alpha-1,6-D-galactosyltransferase
VDDKIEWFGWQADPWKFAQGASALVMTSAHEAFGMVLIESLAHGLPIVSSDCVSGPREVIEPGRSGWLFPVGDVNQLAAILQNMIDHPEVLPAREQVFECAQKFSISAVAARTVKVLRETRERLRTPGVLRAPVGT